MTLAIGIKVDSRQVKDARKQIEVLNRSLTDTQRQSNVELGVADTDNLEETAALLTRIREEVSRMGDLSRTATSRGGMLPKRQFEEASEIAKQIHTDISKWSSEIDKARASLSRLQAEKLQIGRDIMGGKLSPDEIQQRWRRHGTIDDEIQQAQSRVDYMDKHQGKLAPLHDRARQYSQVLQNTGVDPEAQGNTLKRAMGFALAAAGGFSVLSFLSQSRGMYQQYAGHENRLHARGVRDIQKGANAATDLGVDPFEHYALQEQLTHGIGLSGKRLDRMTRNAELFSRYYGISGSEVAGFGSSVYQASGARGMGSSALITLQQQGIEKTRMPETMRLMESHLRVMAQARGGAGLSEANVATALQLATAAMREGRPEHAAYLKSGNLANTLQNGLQGAGSTPGEIALFNAVGGFDGPMTYEKIHKMNRLREGGFLENPELLAKVMQHMPKGLSRTGRAGWLESVFPQWAKGKAAEQFLDLYDRGALTGLKRNGLGGNEDAARGAMEKDILTNPAAAKMIRMAKKTDLKITAGEGIDAIVGPIEETALQGADKFLGSDFVSTLLGDKQADITKEKLARESQQNPYYQHFLAAAKKYGVSEHLLMSMASAESGFNPKAVSPKGAQGIMQLMPATARQLGVKNPMDPAQSIDGAARHLKHLGEKYGWEMEPMVAAYNMGEGKYDRYGIAGGGAETRGYLKKVRGDFLARTGMERLPEEESVGQRLATRTSNIADMGIGVIVGLLERIADALEQPANFRQAPAVKE